MAEKSFDLTNRSVNDATSNEYSESSGKSPLEWLELKEGICYSQLDRISGERKILNKFIENPVVTLGLISGLVAIGGGLYSIRSSNPRMSNHFLKLRWSSSTIVFGYIVYKIWDRIDWNPPSVQKLQRYIAYAFKKDIGLLTDEEASKVKQTSVHDLK